MHPPNHSFWVMLNWKRSKINYPNVPAGELRDHLRFYCLLRISHRFQTVSYTFITHITTDLAAMR